MRVRMGTPTTRRTAALAAVLLCVALLLALALASPVTLSTPPPVSGSSGEAAGAQRPNVVLIVTDDQPAHSLSSMPKTNRLLLDRGASFTDAVVTFPICCPSRATILTGQYAHNHGVLSNKARYQGGYNRLSHRHTLPVWLKRAGYRTAHVGKYLNGYGRTTSRQRVPPGWARWWGAPGQNAYRMWDYKLNHNGRLVHHGERRRDYQTDVYARLGARFIRAQKHRRKPFFLSIATLAPHDEAKKADPRRLKAPRPAPRHRRAFRGSQLPDSPAFNERDVSDKPPYVARLPRLSARRKQLMLRSYREQLRSLLAVDDLVARVVRALSSSGQLRDTYVIFTSDNGYLLGEHRLLGKSHPYEESVRAPIVIRGPGIEPGAELDGPAANLDLAPTILDLTNATADRRVDGISLFDAARGERPLPARAILLENFDRDRHLETFDRRPDLPGLERRDMQRLPLFTGIRDRGWVYLEFKSGTRELYDLRSDPHELQNLASEPAVAAIEAGLADRLERLRDCSGRSCSSSPN